MYIDICFLVFQKIFLAIYQARTSTINTSQANAIVCTQPFYSSWFCRYQAHFTPLHFLTIKTL